MNAMIEKLACKIGEGVQTSAGKCMEKQINVFHRRVNTHQSSDLSFINGLISSGLRGSAILDGEQIINNYHQLLTASRRNLALVVNTDARLVGKSKFSNLNNYDHIHAVHPTGCFQLIATSPQEEIYLTLLAHRIAELSLIPGIVIADYKRSDEEYIFPTDELIIQYLGEPDDQIECPTPAQKIIFGRTRRRIPNWFSFDTPVVLGSQKKGEALSYEGAASQKYFYDHLPELVEQALQEFYEVFKVQMETVVVKGKKSPFALITLGGQISELFDEITESERKVEFIQINQLSPFPAKALSRLLQGKKSVTILENISGQGVKHSPFYYKVLDTLERTRLKVYSGKYSSDLNAAALEKSIRHMLSGQAKIDYYLGIPFTKTDSPYPKHQILLQEIEKQYPEVLDEAIFDKKIKHRLNLNIRDEIPMAIRMHKDQGPNYSRLSRFYDHTAFFYEHDEQDELVADPFNAVPVVPGGSASFFNQSSKRKYVPVFNPEKCTGCGDCFIYCPHSALPPIAIGVEQLMKTGIAISSEKGSPILRLPPMLKNLAKIAANIVNDMDASKIGDFLQLAFERLTAQMKLAGEKLEIVQNEFERALDEILAFPAAFTDTFFYTPSLIDPGSGELFSITVNPVACTGCSICAEVCEEDALSMELQDEENLATISDQFRLWEQLPDTSGDTINRLIHDKDFSSLAAILLSRNYYMTMAGASDTNSYSPFKTLLHIITATTEAVVQPKIRTQLKQLDSLIDSLSENVHKKLSDALPDQNLDVLAKSLARTQRRKIPIQDLVSKMAEQEHGKFIDSEELARKANLVEDLKHLKWILTEGPGGAGRSRYGLLLSGSDALAWAKQYPSNNFTGPSVIHWNGSAPEESLALFNGQLRYLLDHIKLMRRAELELKDKYDPTIHDPEIAQLSWENLTDTEKKLIPPVLLVAENEGLNDFGWNSLNRLLAEKYPVKICMLDHMASPEHSPVSKLAQTNSGLFSAIALKNAFVFQGGMGNVEHLFMGLADGLDKSCPALFKLYATDFTKHEDTGLDWSPYASLALNSRAFPALRFDPVEKSDFLKGAIKLDGNKENKEDWVQESMTISGDETIKYKITWADWAFTQKDWKNQFQPLEDHSLKALVPDYINLNESSRAEKVPVIMRIDEHGLKYYAVSDLVIKMTEAVLSNWKTLQELAGLTTEFPIKLRAEITKELIKQFEQEAENLKKDYEQRLKEQETAQTEVLRQQLKEKLIALSRMAKNRT